MVSVDSLDISVEGCLPSVSLTQKSQFTPLGMAGDVHLSEHHIVTDHVAEETAVVSSSMALQESTASSSSKTSIDTSFSQGCADFTENGFTLKEHETKVPNSSYSGAMAQQAQGETAQVVTIVPTQVRIVCLSPCTDTEIHDKGSN